MFVNQADGTPIGLHIVECVQRVALSNTTELGNDAVLVSNKVQLRDTDGGTWRKMTASHHTNARWVLGSANRPSNTLYKEFVDRQNKSLPKIYLGQNGDCLLNSAKFGDAPNPIRVPQAQANRQSEEKKEEFEEEQATPSEVKNYW